jgi:tetratricopeptide (TPR) repeat protein
LLSIALAVPAAAQSRQDLYNSAQAAFDRRDWVAAADGFHALVKGVTKANRGNAIIHARLAQASIQLGNFEEGVNEARASAAMLVALGAEKDDELANAYSLLGDGFRFQLEADEAIEAYQHALGSTAQAYGFFPSAALGLATVAATVQPDLAVEAMQNITRNKPLFDSLEPQTRGAFSRCRPAPNSIAAGPPKAIRSRPRRSKYRVG